MWVAIKEAHKEQHPSEEVFDAAEIHNWDRRWFIVTSYNFLILFDSIVLDICRQRLQRR